MSATWFWIVNNFPFSYELLMPSQVMTFRYKHVVIGYFTYITFIVIGKISLVLLIYISWKEWGNIYCKGFHWTCMYCRCLCSMTFLMVFWNLCDCTGSDHLYVKASGCCGGTSDSHIFTCLPLILCWILTKSTISQGIPRGQQVCILHCSFFSPLLIWVYSYF